MLRHYKEKMWRTCGAVEGRPVLRTLLRRLGGWWGGMLWARI
jgi:hypothetical protein